VRAVQISMQDTNRDAATAIAGRDALARKLALARQVRALGLSLTCNFVLHAGNVERIGEFLELALELGADRVELAHAQMHGWAAHNHQHLLPTRAQLDAADAVVAAAKQRCAAIIELVYVRPDVLLDRPKPCMGGWGTRAIVVDPAGTALPCHGARSLPLSHANVRAHSLATIWSSETFEAFRGDAWMEEPCRSCTARAQDFGGCRCRAYALTGRLTATDPVCSLAPEHATILAMRAQSNRSRPLQLRTFK
jgi:pyrroloquinoline quinone biosynthesis protein E